MMKLGGVIIVALGLVACQPWYRDDVRRGRAAKDDKRIERLLDEASSLHAKGQSAAAADKAWRAIELDPFEPSSTYLAYATYAAAAGRGDRARAVVRWRLQRSADSELREFVISSYVAEQRIADALDFAAPGTLEGAASIAALRPALGELAAADSLRANDPPAALAQYLAWLHGYGVPDHPLLAAARERILQSATNMARWSAGCGTPMPPALAIIHELLSDPAGSASQDVAVARAAYTIAYQVGALASLPASLQKVTSTDAAGEAIAVRLAAAGDDAVQRRKLGEAVALYRRAVAAAPWWLNARDNLAALQARLGRDPIEHAAPRGATIAVFERADACRAAAEYYDRTCRAGRSESCTILAPLLAEGRGTTRDEERACNLGDGASCREIGRRHQRARTEVRADPAQAALARKRTAELARERCDKKVWPACLWRARDPATGLNRAAVDKLLDRACRGGDHAACVQLAKARVDEPRKQKQAIAALRRACDAGEPTGCQELAHAHMRSTGGALDPAQAPPLVARAVELLRTGCDGGDGQRCVDLALAYRTGQLGLAASERDADTWRTRARTKFQAGCDRGVHDDCAQTAAWLLDEPERDGIRARDVLQRACAAGSIIGCERLAALHGAGVAESKLVQEANRNAAGYYRRACEARDNDGCALLREVTSSD